MSFVKALREPKSVVIPQVEEVTKPVVDAVVESVNRPEDILRKEGFKIKLVTPTSFGTQIDFAKKYDKEDIETALKDFSIKIREKSVFIVN